MITKELINSEVEKLRKELLAKLEEEKTSRDWVKLFKTECEFSESLQQFLNDYELKITKK